MRTLTITSLPFTLFDFLSDMRASKLRSFGPCNFTIPCLYRQLGSSIACILVALCPCNRCKAQCLCCRICRSKDSYRIRPISLHLELLECLWFWFKEFDRPTKRAAGRHWWKWNFWSLNSDYFWFNLILWNPQQRYCRLCQEWHNWICWAARIHEHHNILPFDRWRV